MQVFHFRVDRENRSQHMFTQDVITTIFSNVKSIYLFHAEHVLPQVSLLSSTYVCVSQVNVLFITNMILKTNRWNVLGDNLGVSRNPFLSHKHKNLHEKSCLLFAMRILFLHTSLPSLSHFLGENLTNWFVKMFYPVIKITTFSSKNVWTNGRRVPSTRG